MAQSLPSQVLDTTRSNHTAHCESLTEADENRRRLREQHRLEDIATFVARIKAAVGRRYSDCTFDNFELSADEAIRDRQSAVVDRLKKYHADLRNMVNSGVNIVLNGPVGCGKDHLLSAMMIAAAEEGARVAWRDGISLAAEFRTCISSDEPESKLMAQLTACNILGISDPVGPNGTLSTFTQEKLFAVIDARYREKKTTWVTMNSKSRADAEDRMSSQIIDRLTDGGLCITCDWPSYRLTRRLEAPENG